MNEGRSRQPIAKSEMYPSPLAGLLSYLIPGLGQIYQKRYAKGILFFVSLYGLFFYGMYLGHWRNVYVYHVPADMAHVKLEKTWFGDVTDRARFIAQAWIGAAAWPAIIQYQDRNRAADSHPVFGTFQRLPSFAEQERMLRDYDKHPDLGWVYTVIAGVLNILVIYDAYAGPIFPPPIKKTEKEGEDKQQEEARE